MNELKPCPFCGGDACIIERKLKTGFNPSGGTFYVHCKQCNIRTEPRIIKNKVIEAWNRRADDEK